MQAIKEKLNDMSHMRRAKADARQEEQEEKELAKTRIQVAKEVRMAREAEAAMDLHVNKAAEKVAAQEAKAGHSSDHHLPAEDAVQDPHGHRHSHTSTTDQGTHGHRAADTGSTNHDYSTGGRSLI